MRTIAVIQARMGSSRLPGKVLLPILGRPMLQRQIERIRRVGAIDRVVVATSDLPADDPIARFCEEIDAACHRGNEQDVLDRFLGAALAHEADTVLRFTADCPLVDPGLVARLIEEFRGRELDYMGIATGAGVAREGFQGRYPDGLDAEIMSFEALERAWQEAEGPLYREHVTPWIWKHPDRFRVGELASETDLSGERWTVDHESDYRLVSAIFERLYPGKPEFDYRDVLELLEREIDLRPINREHNDIQENYKEFLE